MPDYFTLAELRALPDMNNTSKYTVEKVEDAAAAIVGIIERECGTSFITRIIVDEPHNGGGTDIVVDDNYPRALISVTESGVAIPAASMSSSGVLSRSSSGGRWLKGTNNVLVTYEAGYSSAPPPDIKRAALKATRLELLSSGDKSSANARRTSLSTELGVENFVVAGEDRPTGYPEIDAVIIGWKSRLDLPGFS